MDVMAILNGLRRATPCCNAAALVDLETCMVLASEGDTLVPQETWEDLAATAVDLLGGPTSISVATALSNEMYLQSAVLRFADQLQLMVRSDAEPPLAMLFICEAGARFEELIQASALELETIAAVE